MRRLPGWLIGMLLCAAVNPAGAQSLRDPTLPPVEAGVAGAPAAGNSLQIESGSTSVIVRNGRSYLVVGTRLYAQGQKLGQARIERITETEVWLREAGQLRKVQRFSGVERHVAAAPVASTGCATGGLKMRPAVKASKASKKTSKRSKAAKSGSPAPSPAVAPCVDARP
jgi:hypothetical protein